MMFHRSYCGCLLAALALVTSAQSAVVLDQIGLANSYILSAGLGSALSQIVSDSPNSSSMVLEDFTVQAASGLRISQISALFRADEGFSSFSNVTGYFIGIFSSAIASTTSLAGDVESLFVLAGSGASVTQVAGSVGGFEYGLVNLVVDIPLVAGTYWLGVAPQTDGSIGYFRLLSNGTNVPVPPGNTNAKLANPGMELGAGALSALDADYAYKITAVPEPTVAVLWLLGGWGWLFRRNRALGHRPSRSV